MDKEILSSAYLKYKICVSGAAETEHCSSQALEQAKELGREIARQNCVLVTGATTGAPHWASIGAKEEGGISIGLSPAVSKLEHVEKYKLPTDYLDLIIYTGFNYSGRNLLLTRASDAVIFVCGRVGTLNEFTIAFEDDKPIGVLEHTGGTADLIREIMPRLHRGMGGIVFGSSPKKLLEDILEIVKKEKAAGIPIERQNH